MAKLKIEDVVPKDPRAPVPFAVVFPPESGEPNRPLLARDYETYQHTLQSVLRSDAFPEGSRPGGDFWYPVGQGVIEHNGKGYLYLKVVDAETLNAQATHRTFKATFDPTVNLGPAEFMLRPSEERVVFDLFEVEISPDNLLEGSADHHGRWSVDVEYATPETVVVVLKRLAAWKDRLLFAGQE